MPTIVVPFRGPGGKQRLAPLGEAERAAIAQAMLADVLAACAPVGDTVVVAPVEAHVAVAAAGATAVVADPGRGQGAAVEAALAELDGPVLVVNADLPCATAADVGALLAALPARGLALVAAADGTTNALALSSPRLFRPLYGAGSSARFRALARSARAVPIANLMDDVDTVDDLRRLEAQLGSRTRRALAAIALQVGAPA